MAALRLENHSRFLEQRAELTRRDSETWTACDVEDVALSSNLATGRDALLKAGVRGLQAMPVTSRSGELLAVLTTYYQTVRRTDERAFQPLDLLARQAADVIERAQADANLRSAYEQAEAAIRAKDEFLAVISHELRSPLTSILVMPGYFGTPRIRCGGNTS
jgi:signal transduction histidine kinase